MLKQTTTTDLTSLLMRERKYVDPADAEEEAKRLAATLDESLDAALESYIRTGKYSEVAANGMTLLTIKSLRRCGYLEAAVLLDTYIKDPEAGLAAITRR